MKVTGESKDNEDSFGILMEEKIITPDLNEN